MDVIPANGMLAEFKGDAVALGVFENPEKGKPPALPQSAQKIDSKAGGIISASVKAGEFTGKLNSVMIYHAKGVPSRIILLVGLGKKEEFEADIARQSAGKACCAARDLGAKKLAFCADSVIFKEVKARDAGRLLTEGAILGLYKFQSHKSEAEKKELKELHLLTKRSAKEVAEGARYGEIAASSANIAREIANSPGNLAHPQKMAAIANELAMNYGFKCKVLGKKEMMKEKMGGMLSVTAGSHQPPAFVVLEYEGPKSKGKKPVVLIGKGITFDSGGISIKPSKDMDRMKFDKSGACAVIGAFIAASRAKL